VVFDQTAPNAGGQNGSMLVRFAVNKAGVRGTGMIVLYPRDGNYMIAGKGAGKAAGKQGTGRMSAVRTSTGVDLPSTTQQIKDLFSMLIGKKISSTTSTSGGATGGSTGTVPAARPVAVVSDDAGVVFASAEVTSEAATTPDESQAAVIKKAPDVVFVKAVAVEPASAVDLAAAKPPATTQTVIATLGLLIVLTVAAAIVSIGPKVRRQEAVATTDAPRNDGEGS
jgi:hypothetical protein